MGLYLQLRPPPFYTAKLAILVVPCSYSKIAIIFASTQLLQSFQSLLYFVVCTLSVLWKNKTLFSSYTTKLHENQHCGWFLAFCQHVQYWRTGCQAFTTDFQCKHVFDKSIVLVRRLHQAVIHSLQTHKLSHIHARSFLLHYLTPSYSILSDLGRKLFSKGNVQDCKGVHSLMPDLSCVW